MTTRGAAIRFGVFLAVSLLASALVINTLTHPIGAPVRSYNAVFSDVEGLRPGSDVRIAGVRVGQITGIELADGKAEVSFDVADDQRVPNGAGAAVRYADLLGGRYLALTPGGGGELPDGATIPLGRTQPALDLTALLNGFKPLFEAIEPAEVNQLAAELVAVFQGESANITSLLERVVAVTADLSERDQVIGELLTNLNSVLGTMNQHRDEMRATVDKLTELVSAMAADRHEIADAVDSAGALAGSLSETLAGRTPRLTHDVASLRDIASSLVANEDEFNAAIQDVPETLKSANRTLDYGSWLNVYVCNLSVSIAGAPVNLGVGPHSEVCR